MSFNDYIYWQTLQKTGKTPEEIYEYEHPKVVRCKECKWGKPYSDKQLECDALGLGGLKFPDDFCSYGEREGE